VKYPLPPETTLLPLLGLRGYALAGCRSDKHLLVPESTFSVQTAPVSVVNRKPQAPSPQTPQLSSIPASRPIPSTLARLRSLPLTSKVTHPLKSSSASIMRRVHRTAPAAVSTVRRPKPFGQLAYSILISLLLLVGIAVFTVLGLILFPISALWGILSFVVALAAVLGLLQEVMHMIQP
jgi:hypothetical protein